MYHRWKREVGRVWDWRNIRNMRNNPHKHWRFSVADTSVLRIERRNALESGRCGTLFRIPILKLFLCRFASSASTILQSQPCGSRVKVRPQTV